MISTMLKPFFKRFIGLFVSMVFVSMLSIALLSAFASTIYNLNETFTTYLADYGSVDSVIALPFTETSKLEGVKELEGVEEVQYRLTIDSYLQKSDGRTITARIHTYKQDGSSLFGRYVLERTAPNSSKINVSVVRKFAENNGFKVGDTIKMGYFGIYLDFYVSEIIETPEAIQARANNYVWSDNTDFGYVYINEKEVDRALLSLAKLVKKKIQEDESFRHYYEEATDLAGNSFPDLIENVLQKESYTSSFANQMLVKAKEGYSQEEITYTVQHYLTQNGVEVKSATENHKMFYYQYIKNAIRQLKVGAIFLPLFFYSVTMIVIGLFINQMIKAMTPQIGIMMSIGSGKRDIISIFLAFSLVMAMVSGILGVTVGMLLNKLLASIMITVYSMPTIPWAVNLWITTSAVLTLLIFTEITTMISCRQIFKITPKDATISNEAARKHLSPRLERVIERAPMNIKLSLNSIAQNPRRFFVSVFSIFASFVIILLALFFFVSKNTMMDQTMARMSFDAQVYLAAEADEALVADVKSQKSVKAMVDCYYTYAEVTSLDGKTSTYLECLAYDETVPNEMILIPDSKGKGDLEIQAKGVILPTLTAKTLGVKAGDTIKVNGVPVKVSALSNQYFHPITYLSKTQMRDLDLSYVSSFLVQVNDEDEFLAYMSEKNASLTVFTKYLKRDIHGIFDSINVFIYILIGFSLFMGFIILTIMSQNALMEQKRQISVLRLIGFRVFDISNMWTLQSFSQLLFSSLFAIPVGVLSSAILFGICSSASQAYPLVVSIPTVLFAFAFIFVIILSCHLLSMLTIKRWNLADNTRSRE